MIKYILLDLDGTIFDFNKGERNAFTEVIKEKCGYLVTNNEYLEFSKINDFYFKEYQNKKITRDEFHFNRFKDILEYMNISSNIMELNNAYINKLKYQADLYDDALEAIKYLKKKYILCVSSNGMNDVQRKRLEESKIISYFDKIYISELIGYNKPDKRFFDYIINDIGDYNLESYVIIGDRLDSDILGGANSGIRAIYVKRDDSIEKGDKIEDQVKGLHDIMKILWLSIFLKAFDKK